MNRYKLNYNRKKLSQQELTRHMDFDKFIRNTPPASSGSIKSLTGARSLIMAGVAGVAAIAGYLFYSSAGNDEKFIDPPISGVNIEYGSYMVDGSRDTTIIHQTGSAIFIPANAFADESGRPVQGKVELRYREFHDPLEIFISGIPMGYDSAGTHYQLESAGMFEILAFMNGKPLRVNPASMPIVNMVSLSTGNDFNIYYLDTIERKWEFVSANTRENNTSKVLYDSIVAGEFERRQVKQEEVMFQKEDPNRHSFTIDYNKEEFPELAAFEGLKFQVVAGDRSYDPSLAAKIWQDVYISRVDKNRYTVTFSRENETHTFSVVPVVEAGDFERKMAEYTINRKQRKDKQKQEEEVMMENFRKYITHANWDNVNARLTEFVKKYPVNHTTLAMRTFNINRLGMWNCDRPRRFFSTPRIVNAKLYDQDGKALNTEKLYLMIKDKNTLYTYPAANGQVNEFEYGTADPNYLLAITSDGYPACLTPGEFSKAIGEGAEVGFRMKVYKQKVDDVDDLRSLLNIQ
jgi:hypothetical protein